MACDLSEASARRPMKKVCDERLSAGKNAAFYYITTLIIYYLLFIISLQGSEYFHTHRTGDTRTSQESVMKTPAEEKRLSVPALQPCNSPQWHQKTDRTPHRQPLLLHGRVAKVSFRAQSDVSIRARLQGFGCGERSGKPDSGDYLRQPWLEV